MGDGIKQVRSRRSVRSRGDVGRRVEKATHMFCCRGEDETVWRGGNGECLQVLYLLCWLSQLVFTQGVAAAIGDWGTGMDWRKKGWRKRP